MVLFVISASNPDLYNYVYAKILAVPELLSLGQLEAPVRVIKFLSCYQATLGIRSGCSGRSDSGLSGGNSTLRQKMHYDGNLNLKF